MSEKLKAAALSTEPSEFYRIFHDEYSGIAEAVMGRYATTLGPSIYDVAVGGVPADLEGKSVLDVACGSGPVTRAVLKHLGPTGRVVGVDVSPGEIDLARRQTSDPRVEFRIEAAQSLSAPSESFDVSMCCLALNLIAPLEPVLEEVERVLRTGGFFVVVVGGIGDEYAEYEQAAQEILTPLQSCLPEGASPVFGDPRCNRTETLQALLSKHFEPREEVRFAVLMTGSPEELAIVLPDYFYSFYLLSEKSQSTTRKRVLQIASRTQDESGRACIRIPHVRLTFSKRGSYQKEKL